MAWTDLSDSLVAGDGGHVAIHNEIADNFTYLQSAAGTLISPSGDTSGATDWAAINAVTSNAQGIAQLTSGSYYLNAPLPMAAGAYVNGGVAGSTYLYFASGFTGAAMFTFTGEDLGGIAALTIAGQSSTYSSNPSANGINVAHSNSITIRDVNLNYVNGWAVQIASDATADSFNPDLDNVHSFSCKAGCQLVGTASSDHNMNAVLVNCNFDQCQSGDALQILDVHDVEVANLRATCTAGTGHCIDILGLSSAIYISNIDVGPSSFGHEGIVIQTSSANNPSQVVISGGIVEGCTPNISITAGSNIRLENLDIYHAQSNGISVSGAADQVAITGCTFIGNGQTAGTSYDLAWSSTGKLSCHHNFFTTPLGTSSGEVSAAINPSAGTTLIKDNWFTGATAFVPNFPTYTRGNTGYNPVGPLSAPGVPSTTNALTNPFGVDCTVYVKAGSGSTCAVAIGGTTMATLAASAIGTFRLAQGQTITLTYTSAPTWAWTGD